MASGKCRHCGYEPVAYDAPICPQCAGWRPNASQFRWSALGCVVGLIPGLIWGATSLSPGDAAGAIVGGLILGAVGSAFGNFAGRVASWFQ